jgi:hypothetical protein
VTRRALGGHLAANGKKDHLVAKKGMVTPEFIGFLPRWRR